MIGHAFYQYLTLDGGELFTVVMLPREAGQFPTVIFRSPYVRAAEEMAESELVSQYLDSHKAWLERGYAVVFQHCRGQGKSTGAFVPYVHEREDGLALRKWIREQSFYNGELFLVGASYTASLHYATAPFEPDIKGAIFEVQDYERYRLWYRNGQMRSGHANWHFGLYKAKCGLKKHFSMASFSRFPLKGLSADALGESAEDFEEMLDAPLRTDAFWETRFGGADARGATDHAGIPLLLTTGYNDFYLGGMFRMWEAMDENTKGMSAMLVSPYNHGDGYDKNLGLSFPMGKRKEAFGDHYRIDWLDHIRKGAELPFQKGVITYYRAFEKGWQSDFYATETKPMEIALGEEARSFPYDPLTPPSFVAEGCLRREEEKLPSDVITVYTKPFSQSVFVKGRMKLKLTVQSSAEDTSFYANISIKKPDVEYLLRHDITSLCHQLGSYRRGERVELEICFDEYAFNIEAGDALRIDVAATDQSTYAPHSNRRGAYAEQDRTEIAQNTVYLAESRLILPVEE